MCKMVVSVCRLNRKAVVNNKRLMPLKKHKVKFWDVPCVANL